MSGQGVGMAIMPDLKPKILLIDDDTSFLEDQKDLFERAGGILHTAHNFKTALQFLKKHFLEPFYDYIFVDYEFKNEKVNGDVFIMNNYENIKDTPLAMIAGSFYDQLNKSEFKKKYKIEIIPKQAGLTDRFSQILDRIKENKDGRYNEFVEKLTNLKEQYEKEIIVTETQKVEDEFQKNIRSLFLENISKMFNSHQDETFIIGGKKWSPTTIYAEVENSDSIIGKMAMEIFVNYLNFSIKNQIQEGEEK